MNILGISCHYHEAAAALVIDGKIVAAAANERFTRVKHDNRFPMEAIVTVLNIAGIKKSDLNYVVFYEKPFRKFERHLRISFDYFPKSHSYFVESMANSLSEKLWIKTTIVRHFGIDPANVLFVPHHFSHAAASFYPSPFDEASILTLDGVGEWTTGSLGSARENKILLTDEMRFPHSVGLLYSAFTAYLGFEVNDGEYKVMGMAGYGKPKHTREVRKLFHQNNDGSIRLNLDYFAFYRSSRRMHAEAFVRLFRGADRFDVAASIQKITEEIVFAMLGELYKKTRIPNLAYGGGVALNSALNGKITRETPFRDVFIFPAAGDDGGAVGCALYVYHQVLGNKKRYPLKNVFLGAEYEARFGTRMRESQLLDFVSEQLIAGRVVGWFEGRSEFGPRALGHRSIIADPIDPKMKDIVNTKIKFREEFRPFAPVVLEEHARTYFPDFQTNLSAFMLATYNVSAKAKSIASATTHVDNTSRIQIVGKDYPGKYRRLLEVFYKKTKRPVLLNTSFNLKGEPIVETPDDARKTFLKSGLDILVVDNYILSKK